MKTRREFVQALAGLLAVFPLRRALAQDQPQLGVEPGIIADLALFQTTGRFPDYGPGKHDGPFISDAGVPMAADNRKGDYGYLPVLFYFDGKPLRNVVAYDIAQEAVLVEDTDPAGNLIYVEGNFRTSVLFGRLAVKWNWDQIRKATPPDRIEAELDMDFLRADAVGDTGATWPR